MVLFGYNNLLLMSQGIVKTEFRFDKLKYSSYQMVDFFLVEFFIIQCCSQKNYLKYFFSRRHQDY